MLRKLLIIAIVLLPALAAAQRTTVTGTVLDPNGNAYANGTFSADYIPAAGCVSPPTLSGSPFQTSIPGALTAAGALPSLSLADNNVACTGSQWRFSICNSTKVTCFQVLITITGASQTVTSAIQAAAAVLAGTTLPSKEMFTASTTANATANVPAGTAPTTSVAGDFWNDSTQGSLSWAQVAGDVSRTDNLICQSANNASTVVNTQTTLTGSSCTMAAGRDNFVGKTIRVHGYATYSITTGTPTIALNMNIGSTTVVTCTTTATTNGVTVNPIEFLFEDSVLATGATGNDLATCKLVAVLGASATAAGSTFVTVGQAATSNYDHTASNAIVIQGLAAGASNAIRLWGPYTVEIVN